MSGKKVALVTGANRGLGLETAKRLADAGYRVVITARDSAKAEVACAELAKPGRELTAAALDVADGASIGALALNLNGDGVRLDVLVNNAGIALKGFDATVARRTIDTNFHGPMRVTDALRPLLTPDARIVMVSSELGTLSSVSAPLAEKFASALSRSELVTLVESFVSAVAAGTHAKDGWPSSAYAVSKVGLNALTKIYARELATTGIVVNAVCPGWVRTGMGGARAPRTVEQGAEGIVWAATLGPDAPRGGFFQDAQPHSF